MNLSEELQASPRLRVGLVAIVAILIVYGLLEWRDHLIAGKADYRRLLTQLSRAGQYEQAPESAEVWRDRASEAAQALVHAQGRLWRNTSAGQAQAQVQDWLNRLLRQVDAKQFTLRVAEPETSLEAAALAARLPADMRHLLPLRVRLDFNSDPAVLLGLLAALNDSPHKVSVDILNVKGFKTEMALTFWFSLDEEKTR